MPEIYNPAAGARDKTPEEIAASEQAAKKREELLSNVPPYLRKQAAELYDKKNPEPGLKVVPPKSKADQYLEALVEEGRLTREGAFRQIRDFEKAEYGKLKSGRDSSNFREQAAVDDLRGFNDSAEMAPIDFANYVGDYDSKAAGAFADKRARDAQYGALDKLKGWTDPSMTAEEKFMMASARNTEERDQRAAREAALRDMSARGVRSGASEMAAMLGGQQITSQNRMLQDLGAQANASRRALGATQAYGGMAGDIAGQTFNERFQTGSAADIAAQFNNKLRTQYNFETQQQRMAQQDARFGRADTVTGRQMDAAGNSFSRNAATYGFGYQGARDKAGIITDTGRDITEGRKAALGYEEATLAAKAAKKPKRAWYEVLADPAEIF